MRAELVAFALFVVGCGGAATPARPPGARADRPPEAAALRACELPNDCMVAPRTCCGRCGAATPSDAIAVNASYVREHHGYPCEGEMGCPDCAMQTAPTLRATCQARRCEVLDLASEANAACASDDDCALRSSVCCDCGQAPWIAIRADRMREVGIELCTEIATCPACAAPYPMDLRARCVESRCVAVEE